MEIILLLITSGIPGFYTYYALSNKNVVYFNSDNKNIILSLFSIISIFIFLLILSLFSGVNNVNELFNQLTFIKILLSLIVSVLIIIVLTEFIYTSCIKAYNKLNNQSRENTGLNNTESLPIHLTKYENSNYKMFITVKDFSNNLIERGFLDNYSRKNNRNIILDTRENDNYENFLKLSTYQDSYIDFENGVKLEYLYIDKKIIKNACSISS